MRVIQTDLTKDYSDVIREAVAVLRAGGVIVYPTDTLYGLGANALDAEAVEKVFVIKRRSRSKPLPILVKNMIWAKELAHITRRNEEIMANIFPSGEGSRLVAREGSHKTISSSSRDGFMGYAPATPGIASSKVTVILPKKDIVPDETTSGQASIGLRIADHPLVDELLGRFGYPLTSTSANISGDEPTRNIDDIVAIFSAASLQPDLVIDVGTLPPSEPSTVVDLTTDKPKIIRVGATKPADLLKLLELQSKLQNPSIK